MSISILLERALPLSKYIRDGIESGEFTVFGGTIRDKSGRIVKHLVFPQGGEKNTPDNTEIMGQLANQTAMLAAINIISAHNTNETLGKKLEEISDKIDQLDKKAAEIHDEVVLARIIKFSEIKSATITAIEEVLYANKKQKDPEFIRLHIIPLRKSFNDLHVMLTDLLREFSNKKLIENINFLMLITDLKNKSAQVLGQIHIRLGEDEIAQNYFDKNMDSNFSFRSRLESMKKTGAFSPHVINQEQLASLKSDVAGFKILEAQSLMLSNQNKLALEMKVPHYQLLNNLFDSVHMLDPVLTDRQ